MDIYEQQEQQEEALLERQHKDALNNADFERVCKTPEGRRFVRRVLGECGVYQSSFTGDAQTTAYREGMRSIGLWLVSLFDNCPETYIQLLTEKSNDRPSE
jgi:hypothetical protein